MNENRIHIISNSPASGDVVYWMSRDQRAFDNWALIHAMGLAGKRKCGLVVVFCLAPGFLNAGHRQYEFMLKGLEEVSAKLEEMNIPFHILSGEPAKEVPKFIEQTGAGILVTDFDPLSIKRRWVRAVSENIQIGFHEVDAHNIVPCRIASEKLEFAAYTIRPKINKKLPEYLEEFPPARPFDYKNEHFRNPDKKETDALISRFSSAPYSVDWLLPGEEHAHETLHLFIKKKLPDYDSKRNDPNEDTTSNLSPYLHFGQISAQRIALEVTKSDAPQKAKDAFLEELIVRRELADNFCFRNPNYDSFEGFHPWAQKSLDAHRNDRRDYIYEADKFENAATHDPLWNAAQSEMVRKGKMHGYMRMYWAKKILEWTTSPESAMEIAIYLNDKYELDGRDPNGYTGIAWSIGGVHDRAWTERPVYGKIRYMNYNGAKRKFDVAKYIRNNPVDS